MGKVFKFLFGQKNLSEQKAERVIIDEFERSLLQIIQMANKSKGEVRLEILEKVFLF